MKPRLAYGLLAFLLCVSLVVPLVSGASWNTIEEWTTGTLETDSVSSYVNLDITHGSTGGWIDGGYNFEASGFAFNASFQPLDNVSEFTLVMWVKLGTNGSDQYILRETGGTNNDFKLYKQGGAERFNFHYGNGTDEEVVFGDETFLYDKLYCVIVTRGSATSEYGVMYHNNTKRVDTDILTPPILAGGDFYLGFPSITANVTFYSFNMYEFSIGDNLANIFWASGPDFIIGNESHYYAMNEGSGDVFYDHEGDVWHLTEDWAGDLVDFPISWNPVTDWGGDLDTFNVTHWLLTEIMVAAWQNLIEGGLSILGFPMMFMGLGIIAMGIKNKVDYEQFFMKWLIIGFAFIGLGFAFAFSPVIAVGAIL